MTGLRVPALLVLLGLGVLGGPGGLGMPGVASAQEPAPGLEEAPAAEPPPPEAPPPTIDVWTEWEVRPLAGSEFLEDEETVRALFEDAMKTRQALTPSAREGLVEFAARLGYQLVDVQIERPSTGVVRAILYLQPRLVIRTVSIHLGWQVSRVSIKEALRQRLRLRVGEVLEVDPEARAVQLNQEAQRLQEFLQDDGFYEAQVTISTAPSGAYGAVVNVYPKLGHAYHLGRITIEPRNRKLAFSQAEIQAMFTHCWIQVGDYCRYRKRFTREQHQADIQRLIERYQKRGYPAARVRSDYDTRTSFDRSDHTVDFTLRIDERRRLAVEYEGNDPSKFPDDDLDAQLTFDDASAADDLEVAASALAIQRYYQKRGWFDAAVSWERARKHVDVGDKEQSFDLIRYRIDGGDARRLREVVITGEQDVGEDELRAVMLTRPTDQSFKLIGGASAVTRQDLDADVQRLLDLYRARGYLQVQVEVHMAPSKEALGDAAVTAALLGADASSDDLYARFTIVEGERTEIERVDVDFIGPHLSTDATVRKQLAIEDHAPYILADLQHAGERLQDWFWHIGRPRAEVKLEVVPRDEHHVIATYHVEEHQEVRIGKVVVRGNFRTKRWVILQELGFDEGALLTDELYARGLRRLRATGLFSSITFDIPNFDDTHDDTVDVVVHVEERNDVAAFIDAEGGYSSLKSVYVKVSPVVPNFLHVGITLSSAVTYGDQFKSLDGAIRIPRWLTASKLQINPDVELSGFLREQDTDRFGTLQSWGGSIAATRTWQKAGGDGQTGRSISATLRYDFRQRNIQEDTVRIAGNAGEVAKSSVTNRAGSIGVSLSWDQRVDARGNLNPLSPDHGWRLEGGASIAHRYLLGQDNFLKFDAIGQWITQLSGRVQLRLEGRYDHGRPLGGAVLLPEVDRFFAGGDDTVRGFPQDRLATEVVEHPLPPFGNITQLEILPAGGNIRMLGTVDVQVRLWQLTKSIPVASALFVDAGVITNRYAALGLDDVRPSIGVALARILTPFGGLSFEWAVPMFPRAVDPPLGRFHIVVALRY